MSLLDPQFQGTDQGAVDSMKAFSAYLLCICALVSMVTAFKAPPLELFHELSAEDNSPADES